MSNWPASKASPLCIAKNWLANLNASVAPTSCSRGRAGLRIHVSRWPRMLARVAKQTGLRPQAMRAETCNT